MKYQRIIGIVFAAMATALILLIPMERRSGLKNWQMASKPSPISAVVRSLRPVYPYSVIPGGVYSPQELERDLSKDRLLREHYADFNFATARVVTTAEARYAYVSYRLGGRLLWTTRKLRIPKGETLLTDGLNYCRTRCGNRLSDVPHRETSAMEPASNLLSLPNFPSSNFPPSLLADNLIRLDSPMVEDAAPPSVFTQPRLSPILPSSGAAFASPLPSSLPLLAATPVFIPAPSLYAPLPHPKSVPITALPFTELPTPPSAVPEPGTLGFGLVAMLGVCGIFVFVKKR